MKSFIYEVANDLGIHARPAANLAQACVNLASAITIKCGDKKANGNNVLQILALNAKKGAQLEISAEGGDEEGAIEAIKSVLADEFSKKKKVTVWNIIERYSLPRAGLIYVRAVGSYSQKKRW